MSSKNVIAKGQSAALKETDLDTAAKTKSSWMIDSSKAVSIGMTDVSLSDKTGVIPQHDVVTPLDYTDYPPFSAEQRTRVNDTYKSIEDNMTDANMAKTIQKQFLDDITAKSEIYLERVEDGEDIEDIRTEQAEFLNGLIESILGDEGTINIINASKENADNEMKQIVSKIIVDMIKEQTLKIDLEKIESVERNKIAARLVVRYKENDEYENIYEGEYVELWEFTNTVNDEGI